MFFLLGALTGLLVDHYLLEPCPEYSGGWEIVSRDTAFDIKTGGGAVSAHRYKSTLGSRFTDRLKLAGDPGSSRIHSLPELAPELKESPDTFITPEPGPDPFFSQWEGSWQDSLVNIQALAYVSGVGCQVDSFGIHYSVTQREIINTERLMPDLPMVGPDNNKGLYLLLQPLTDGTRNGLSIGMSRLQHRYLYGFNFDPWTKRVQLTGGIKIW